MMAADYVATSNSHARKDKAHACSHTSDRKASVSTADAFAFRSRRYSKVTMTARSRCDKLVVHVHRSGVTNPAGGGEFEGSGWNLLQTSCRWLHQPYGYTDGYTRWLHQKATPDADGYTSHMTQFLPIINLGLPTDMRNE